MIRPELSLLLRKWAEVIACAVLVLLALWWGQNSFGVVRWIAFALAAAAAALGVAAVQRVRFAQGGGGLGVVQVDERRVSYFGPLTGGIVDLDDLLALDCDPGARPVPHWILTAAGGKMVAIPVNAEGAEALFDTFASLPGLRPADIVAAAERRVGPRQRLWQRNPPRLH